VVDPINNTATFLSKANLNDVTDPNYPISIAGNLTCIVTLTDLGEPGTSDSISFTLWKKNELWFSSNWTGAQTLEQVLAGGNLVVHAESLALHAADVSADEQTDGQLVTPAEPSTAGLVAHYEFEGNTNDSTGANHGTVTGNPTYVAGKVGQAINLDGAGDYVFIDGSFQLPQYTMAVWFRCDGGSGERDILSAYAPGVVHGILLELRSNDVLRYLHRYPLGTGGGSNIYTTTTYDDGAWHHAAIVKSETEVVLYVGGENEGSTPDSSVFDPADAFGLAVGVLDNERAPLGRFFVGAIDDIRIYERALSQAEIASLAGRTEPFSEPFDLNVDGTVDSKDFAALADEWLDEQLWP